MPSLSGIMGCLVTAFAELLKPFVNFPAGRFVESRRPVREFIDDTIDLTVMALS
jgi:hypothetical protein